MSDSDLQLATAMALPTFVAGEKARLKRASLIVQNRSVLRVLYPVLEPAANAGHTLTAVREASGIIQCISCRRVKRAVSTPDRAATLEQPAVR